MDVIKSQETPKGILVIVDVNQGDLGKFYRRIYRRVALIQAGTEYIAINCRNVIKSFGYCEYNYYGSRSSGGTYYGHAERFANALFEKAMAHILS